MKKTTLTSRIKNHFKPQKANGLVQKMCEKKGLGAFLLKPTTDLQSQQMVGAYIKAFREYLMNGGYIFVRKSRAADVFRQLKEAGVPYNPTRFENMAEVGSIIQFNEPGKLWVIVEDDELPVNVQASRLQAAEMEIRSKIASAFTPEAYTDASQQNRATEKKGISVRALMFIEMDHPSLKGFSVLMAQIRGLGVSVCRVTRANIYDDEVAQLFGLPVHHHPERLCCEANSTQVIGSGPENFVECVEAFRSFYADREAPGLSEVDLDKMRTASNIASIVGSGVPELIDITR